MKRRITNVTRLANQLVDPKPEFVSLVGHGANQEPFKTLKADIADFREQNSEDDMAKAKKETQEINQAEIQRVEFTAKRFKDEAKVKEYLESKGYADFKVTSTDTGFTVTAKSEEDFEGAVKAIDVDDGVKFFIGKLAEGKEKLAEKAEVQKSEKVFKAGDLSADEVVKKYSDCCDYYCGPKWTPPEGKTVADVLSEQFADGSFPGLWQLNDAFYYAMYNLIKDGEIEAVKTLANEYGELIVAILNVLKSKGADTSAVKALFIEKPEEKEMKTEKEKAPVNTEAKDEVKKGDEAPAATDTAAAETAETETPADEAAKVTEDSGEPEKETKSDAPDMAQVIADAVAKAITPIQESLTKLETSMAATQKAATDGLADLSDKVSKTGERVNELESARQTRKSADANGVIESTQKGEEGTEEKAQKAHSERAMKSRLGIL